MERMDFDLLFRWFVGLGIDDPVWDHSVFSKNRDRLLNTEIAQDFLAALLSEPKVKRLLSHEHFSVDGTLLDAWASMKSFRPKDGSGDPPDGGRNREQNFRGEKRSNETHESTTDPDARLYQERRPREPALLHGARHCRRKRLAAGVPAASPPIAQPSPALLMRVLPMAPALNVARRSRSPS